MEIEVWSDVICPWCYIGKRRLEEALRGFGHYVTVTFRAYQLDPTPVSQRLPIKVVMAAKFGGAARAEQMFSHVAGIAAGDGRRLDIDAAIAANTFDAHRLIAWAAAQGRQADMVEAVQRAHFAEGIDVGSHTALAGVAARIGLDQSAALACLASDAGADAVEADLNAARELGITSVPTFVIDRRYAVQGAQESYVLRQALEEIARREAVDAGR